MSEAAEKPLWDWRGASPENLRDRWDDLAMWVEWARHTYRDFLKLPDCWPGHVALRTELYLFRVAWVDAFLQSADPFDGIRWLREFQRSAEGWRQMANCKHEPPFRYEARAAVVRRSTVRQHLEAIMHEPLMGPPVHAPGLSLLESDG
jgi:hypothetical protein